MLMCWENLETHAKHQRILTPLKNSKTLPATVCYRCCEPLARVKSVFSSLKRQGSDVIRRRAQERARGRVRGRGRGRGRGVVVMEENEEQPYYQNLVLQNKWL